MSRCCHCVKQFQTANMILLLLCLFSCLFASFEAEFTLPEDCPDVNIQEKFDCTKFSGTWYNVGSYASDGREIYDCSIMEFQEDNIGFTLKETYIDASEGNKTRKFYNARVDPTFDAEDKAKFIVSYEDGDKILQFPIVILSSDYENYAIAYTCKAYKGRPKKHYVYTWILSRTKDKLEGKALETINKTLAQYQELSEHRQSFVFSDFSPASCAFSKEIGTDVFTNNFW